MAPRFVMLAATLAALAGCGGADDADEPTAPALTGLSSSEVVVGETVDFYGRNFLHGEDGSTRLRFVGTFTANDGDRIPVDLAVTPVFGGTDAPRGVDILTWSRFGPFANPFTGDARPGRFEGRIIPETQAADGLVTQGKALKAALGVGPSLVIEAFEPFEADCGAPAVRALAGIPYHFRVRAAGIKPTRFLFQFNNVNGAPGAVQIQHDFSPDSPVAVDEVGLDQPLIFNPVGEDEQFYVTAVRAIAQDAQGNEVETVLPMTVHRPIEVVYQGTYEAAEYYAPEPVSGCTVCPARCILDYAEERAETRQQSVSVTVSTDWSRSAGRSVSEGLVEGVAVGESRSRAQGSSSSEAESLEEGYGVSYSQSEANNVNYSTSDGETWGWNLAEGETNEAYASRMDMVFGEGSVSGTVGVEAEGSIPGFAKVSGSVETTAGVTVGASTAATRGSRTAVTTNRGYSAGGSRSDSRSFGDTVAEERSQSLSGSYALTTDRSRSQTDTDTRDESRVWSFSDQREASEAVTVGDAESWDQTWQSSTTVSVSQKFSGTLPASRGGVFYRQTTRWVRRAEVRSYDKCGVASHLGELQFNEWTWAPELAIGPGCDALPPSKLPAARCLIPPCGG